MLTIDWNQAIKYAHLVRIAYLVQPDQDYDDSTIGQVNATGYTYQQTIYGSELATDLDPNLGKVVSFGFTACSSAGEVVAVIRGTDSIWDWIHDASFLMLPCTIDKSTGMTEDGFTSVYKSLRTARSGGATVAAAIAAALGGGNATSVTVTGHSLGAALATLLALDVALNTSCSSPTSYTYASPRVGDHIFASAYNSVVPCTYRIANRQDIVPQVPPILPLPYEHANTVYELNPPQGKVAATLPCMHALTSYLWLMDQFAATNSCNLGDSCRGSAGQP
jgi:hypothetical protein